MKIEKQAINLHDDLKKATGLDASQYIIKKSDEYIEITGLKGEEIPLDKQQAVSDWAKKILGQ